MITPKTIQNAVEQKTLALNQKVCSVKYVSQFARALAPSGVSL